MSEKKVIVDFDRFVSLSTDKMVKAKWNYKHQDEFLKRKLINNIKKNGQIENIIVRELDDGMYEVVNGNHRLDVLNEIDEKDVFVYNLGKIQDTLAYRIAIETNETKFDSDLKKLSAVVDDIVKSFDKSDLIETLPYTEDQLDDIISMALSDDTFDNNSDGETIEDEVKPKDVSKISFFVEDDVSNRIKNLVYKSSEMSLGDSESEKVSRVFGVFVEKLEKLNSSPLDYNEIIKIFNTTEEEQSTDNEDIDDEPTEPTNLDYLDDEFDE